MRSGYLRIALALKSSKSIATRADSPTCGAGAAATVLGTTVRVCVGTGAVTAAVVVTTGGGVPMGCWRWCARR